MEKTKEVFGESIADALRVASAISQTQNKLVEFIRSSFSEKSQKKIQSSEDRHV